MHRTIFFLLFFYFSEFEIKFQTRISPFYKTIHYCACVYVFGWMDGCVLSETCKYFLASSNRFVKTTLLRFHTICNHNNNHIHLLLYTPSNGTFTNWVRFSSVRFGVFITMKVFKNEHKFQS